MIYRYLYEENLRLLHGIFNPDHDNSIVSCQFTHCNVQIKRKHLQDHLTKCRFGPRGENRQLVGVKFRPRLFDDEKTALRHRYADFKMLMDLIWRRGLDHGPCFGCDMSLTDDTCVCRQPYYLEFIPWTDQQTWEEALDKWRAELYAKIVEWDGLMEEVDAEIRYRFKASRRRG